MTAMLTPKLSIHVLHTHSHMMLKCCSKRHIKVISLLTARAHELEIRKSIF